MTLELEQALRDHWEAFMDDAREERFREFSELLFHLWWSGEIDQDEACKWELQVQVCPRGGEQFHVGTRHWCAYCGDVHAICCNACVRWTCEWDNPEEYKRMREESCVSNAYPLCKTCRTGYYKFGGIYPGMSSTASNTYLTLYLGDSNATV